MSDGVHVGVCVIFTSAARHLHLSMEGEYGDGDENSISMEGVCWRSTTQAVSSTTETCMTTID